MSIRRSGFTQRLASCESKKNSNVGPVPIASRALRRRAIQRLRKLRIERLESRHLLASDWQNPLLDVDINDDGAFGPRDVLLAATSLVRDGTRRFDQPFDPAKPYLDPNGDAIFTPFDVLFVAQRLVSRKPPPDLTADLIVDSGVNASDRITNNANVRGLVVPNSSVLTNSEIVSTKVRANYGAVVEVERDSDDQFTIDTLTLPGVVDGNVRLRIVATAANGGFDIHVVSFSLDRTAVAPIFDLSPTSDSGVLGDQQTSFALVTLTGTADAGAMLELVQTGATALASSEGNFVFSNVPLEESANVVTVIAEDPAGNISEATHTFIRLPSEGETDPVLDWNQHALEAIRLDATSPPEASRALAIMHSAIFDAINALNETPGRYVSFPAQPGSSTAAAVSAAAHRVLSYVYPAQQAAFDAKLASSLSPIADAQPKLDGIALGQAISDAIIGLRESDGYDTFVNHSGGSAISQWQPTAPMFQVPLLPQWGDVQPFVVTDSTSILPEGPPDLSSQAWADAFNEVKTLGDAHSAVRTAEQTNIAKFWADGRGTYTPAGHWNQIASIVSQDQGLSVTENARLFAQLNVGMADAAILTWKVKYESGFWRPITAIQNADSDGNVQTVADPNWTPLLITPAFPEYVSGHSAFSGAAATILSDIFGTDVSFTVGSFTPANLVRSFSSFDSAASEASFSRVLGGIHYRFSGEDGLALGHGVGQQVLDAFSLSQDTQPPAIVVDKPPVAAAHNIDIQGQILDNLAGLQSASLQIDTGAFTPLSLDATGRFTVTTTLPTDGTADGQHIYRFQAIDEAGNTTTREFTFKLDTQAPILNIASLSNNAALDEASRLTGTVDGTGSAIVRLTYAFDGGAEMPFGHLANGSFDSTLDISRLLVGTHTLLVRAIDAAGNTSQATLDLNLSTLASFRISSFTPTTGSKDVGSTFRPQVFFSRPVDPSSLNSNNFYVTGATGAKLEATIVPAADGSFAWLFFADPMPGGSQMTLHVNGSTIFAAGDQAPLDADRDGIAGGWLESTFRTVSLSPLMGTSLSGTVVDPGPDLFPMTFDDIRPGADGVLHTRDDVFLHPLAGVKVFIIGLEAQFAITDIQGRFHFDSVPAGNVKLVVDGRTATNSPTGFYFPEMVMDLNLRAGQANTAMGTMGTLQQQLANADREEIYLPRLRTDIFQELSATEPTVITINPESATGLTPEERALLTITVDPRSLIGHQGQPLAGGEIGISTVPAELVRDMLPPGLLQHTFDITIQAPGIDRFTSPAPMTFPNVFNAAPGSQVNLLSFDHTTGRLVIEGTATVSADGLSASTDPGTGITHPGWHGLTPPGGPSSPPCKSPWISPSPFQPLDVPPVPVTASLHDYFFRDDAGEFLLSFGNAAQSLDPSRVPCDDFNQIASPLIVKITVDGNKGDGTFLEGLTSMQFSLLPQQQRSIKVGMVKLLTDTGINAATENILFGARVKVEGYQGGVGGQPTGADLINKELFVYRFFDISDNNHTDSQIDFEKTFADGDGKVFNKKPYTQRLPASAQPIYEMALGTDFEFHDTEVWFDPISALGGDTLDIKADTLVIKAPNGNEVGIVTTRGRAVGTQDVLFPRNAFRDVLKEMVDADIPFRFSEEFLELFPVDSSDSGTLRSDEFGFESQITDLYNGIVAKLDSLGSGSIYGNLSDDAVSAINVINESEGDGILITMALARHTVFDTIPFMAYDSNLTGAAADFNSLPKLSVFANFDSIPVGNTIDITLEDSPDNITFTEFARFTKTKLEQGLADLGDFSGRQRFVRATLQRVLGTDPVTIGVRFIAHDNKHPGDHDESAFAHWTDFGQDTFATYDRSVTPDALTGGYAFNDDNTSLHQERWLFDSLTNRSYSDNPDGALAVVENIDILAGEIDGPLANREDGFTTLLANAIAHEITHDLGAIHLRDFVEAYIYGDVMGTNGSSSAELGVFTTFKPLVNFALGLPVSIDDSKAIWEYYKTYQVMEDYRFNTPLSSPGDDAGDLVIGAGALEIFDILPAEDVESHVIEKVIFAPTLADGVGNESQSVQLVLFNTGDMDLTISSISLLSGNVGFSVEDVGTLPVTLDHLHLADLQPQTAAHVITLRFDPSAGGTATDTLRIRSDSFDSDTHDIPIRGLGVSPFGDIVLEVPNNNLGGLAIGAPAHLEVNFATIHNIGAQTLTISDIAIAHDLGLGQYFVGGLPPNLGPGQPLVIAPGDSFSFDIAFDPDSVGLRPGVIEIFSNDPETPIVKQGVVGTGLADTGSALDYGNDFVTLETHLLPGAPALRQVSDDAGNWSFFLPPDEAIHYAIFDPVSGLIADAYDTTPSNGGIAIPSPYFLASTANDADSDGLPDDIELAIGTGLSDTDTDNDGLSDFAEIAQGLDPLGGLGLPTGVVAAATLKGEAFELAVEGSLTDSRSQIAYVATGNYGLAIVDLTVPTTPIILSELNLTGMTTDVAFDPRANLAVLAAGSPGVHIVDVSNPLLPTLIKTVEVEGGASRVKVSDGMAYVAAGNSVVSIDLVTHEVRQTLQLGVQEVMGLAIDGNTLYTLDAGATLRAIALNGLELIPQGAVTLPGATGQLFVGNGIAYAPILNADLTGFVFGFVTADVHDPMNLTLISGSDFPPGAGVPGLDFAATGSGLGLLVGAALNAVPQTPRMDVLVVADPEKTDSLVTRIFLPGLPRGVAIASGLSFIADDTSGLQVVQFQPVDTQGQKPTVSITTLADEAPATPGIQVSEGRTIHVLAEIADDVLVRNVELLVNNQVVKNDVSFPWVLSTTAPIVNQPVTLTLQVRSSDTGGNKALSNVLSIEVIPDVTPPTLLDTTPDEGQELIGLTAIDLYFDEGLDEDLLDSAGVTLTNFGEDDLPGGDDDTTVDIVDLVLRDQGRILTIVPASTAAGNYRLTVDAGILADPAGNHVATSVELNFSLRPLRFNIRADSGTPALSQVPSANPGQEISFVMPWGPEMARIAIPTIGIDGSRPTELERLEPSRTDPVTRTAFFIVPDDAITGAILLLGGGIDQVSDLPNWTVVNGSVDVVGQDVTGHSYQDNLPGNGLYLDLGSSDDNLEPLESKTVFDLTPGDYELRFDLAGSRASTHSVTVSLGGAFTETFTRPGRSPFETFTRTITVTAPTAERLVFDHQSATTLGLHLDNVKLTQIDSGAILLDDHFDLPFVDGTIPLQIVPILTGADVTSVAADGSNAVVTLRGKGFIEGENSTYHFGSVAVIDSSASDGPDVLNDLSPNQLTNANIATLTLPLSPSAFGAISVTTAGGRSAPFTVGVSTVIGTALSGSPANAAIASANPGQSITINGAGLTKSTDIVVQYADTDSEATKTLLINPTLTDLDGTSAQIILPTILNDVVRMDVFGSDSALVVQIVPVIEHGDVNGAALTHLTGRGFVEGDSEYQIGDIVIFDAEINGGPDVTGDNSEVDLTVAVGDSVPVTVTTSGGTSAAILVNVAEPQEPLRPMISGIVSVASDGVPADEAIDSANTGQVITIEGANFRLGDLQIIFPTHDEEGVIGIEGVAPLAVNEAGTLAEVRVPNLATTGRLRVTHLGNRNLGFGDAADAIHRAIEIEFTPESGTVELRFADGGLQGPSNEGWGIDNVQIIREAASIFSDDFEGASRPEWSMSTTGETPLFSRFSGPFSTSVQKLTLTGLTAGAPHTLRFDLYVLDSWDGLNANGPDRFFVLVDGEAVFDEAFSNDPAQTQTFSDAEGVLLQIVPTITGTTPYSQGSGYEAGREILGSGFMEGASTITIGGLEFQDHFARFTGTDPNVMSGTGNKSYELGPTPFILNGPVRVTTAGGYFEALAPLFRPPPPVQITSILATAEQGVPIDPSLPSANAGQEIILLGSFTRLTNSGFNKVLVEFDAVDDSGRTGTVTRDLHIGLDRHFRRVAVVVPEIARTGLLRAVGSSGEFFLQIVPTLDGVGPLIPGMETVLQGTGLFPGDLSLSVDGQPVTSYSVRTIRNSDDFHALPDRQFVTFAVPTSIGPGIIRAVTSGGIATLQTGVGSATTPALTPGTDVGDTIGAALELTTTINDRLSINSDVEARTGNVGDIDVYQFNFQAGERLVLDLVAETFSDGDSAGAIMRAFNSAGRELFFDYERPESPEDRLEFTAPFSGTYFLGVSDIFHADYNPLTGEQFPGEAPDGGYPTGAYQLHIRRLASNATTLTGITATALRGTPTSDSVASANAGQLITLTGSGLRIGERVVFTHDTDVLIEGTTVFEPRAVSADGTSLTIRVPDNAFSGIVRLSAEAVGIPLQIVPTLDELEVRGTQVLGERLVEFSGTGFDLPATIQFGSAKFDVQSHFNDTIGVNHTGAPLGPASITTPGGTSAVFAGPDMVSVVAIATSGIPANASLPSANPGQTITIEGSRFKAFEVFVSQATPLIFQTIDAAGIRGERLVEPTSADANGERMTIVVPLDAVTGSIGVVGDPQGTTILLQIVPLVTSVTPASQGVVQVIGSGLIEGEALYRFGSKEVLDGSVAIAGVDVLGNNDAANVDLGTLGSGSFTVTTAGGTSAPIPFGALLSLLADPAPTTGRTRNAAPAQLTPDLLRVFVAEAVVRFTAAGVSPELVNRAQTVTWQVGDLPGNYLGLFTNRTILLDENAAGWGWFIDSTPADDSEFITPDKQAHQDRMDLLTVVMHELGHVLGLDHDDEDVMAESLIAGVRRTKLEHGY